MSPRDILHRPIPRNLHRIRIARHVKLPPQVLRPDKRQANHVHVHARHEDADDLSVVVPAVALGAVLEGEVLAESRLNG